MTIILFTKVFLANKSKKQTVVYCVARPTAVSGFNREREYD